MRNRKRNERDKTSYEFYLHCSDCIKENGAPGQYAVVILRDGLRLRMVCETHDKMVAEFTLAEPLSDLRCAFCDRGVPHEH
jgi:hypothetical protein